MEAAVVEKANQLNILFILTDNQTADSLGCYGNQ